MVKAKHLIQTFIAVILVLTMMFLASGCSCNEMKGEDVQKNFVNFINEENDFLSFDNGKLVINYGYKEDVEKALNLEKQYYENNSVPFSDFYIIKSIYEPMIERALSQVKVYYNILKDKTDDVDLEKANTLNECIKEVSKDVKLVQGVINDLNNNERYFSNYKHINDKNGGIGIIYTVEDDKDTYRDNSRDVYIAFKDKKKCYENLIRSLFKLNNCFLDIYFDIVPAYNFSIVELAELSNQGFLDIVSNYLNYMLGIESYISFAIDGNDCSFCKSSETFTQMYSGNNSKTNTEFASKYVYNEHFAVIGNLPQFNILLSNVSGKEENILNAIIVCQNRFIALKNQLNFFETSINKINFKDYVTSGKSPQEYVGTLSGDKKAYFMNLFNFIDECYYPLATSLNNLNALLS